MEKLRRVCVTGITGFATLAILCTACASGSGDGGDNDPENSGTTNQTNGETANNGSNGEVSSGGTTGNSGTASNNNGTGGADDQTSASTPKCDATLVVATGTCNIIDDFEVGDGDMGGRATPPGDGRGPGGSWDVVRPTTLTSTYELVSVSGGAPGSTQGVHWAATGVDADQGASIGLSFGPCYGADPTYTGFTFWAKAAEQVDIIAGVNDAMSHGEVDCHGADSSEPGDDSCYGSFRKTVTVTDTWQQFTINWGDLVQASWGIPQHPLEPNKLVSLVFIALADFDVTIDDVEFIGGDASACGGGSVSTGDAGL